ncbi:MAG: hypothetical protein WBQ94_01255 [Terracidiphilus sp.]
MGQAKNTKAQLAGFIAKYDVEIADLAETILAEMRKLYPTALELVYDNYNALAIGFCPTDRTTEAIFSIALYPRWVSLFFLQARELPDPDKLLRGSGSTARHIVLPSPDALYHPAVRSLMREAEARAKVPFDPKGERRLIIRSISAAQRPRRPAAKSAPTASRSGIESKGKRATAGARKS